MRSSSTSNQQRYQSLQKDFDNSIKSNWDQEYYLISKKWISNWKQHVNFAYFIKGTQLDIPALTSKLQPVNQEKTTLFHPKALLKYYPHSHPFNVFIQKRNKFNKFEIYNSKIFQMFSLKYNAEPPLIRSGFTFNQKKQIEIDLLLINCHLIIKKIVKIGILQVSRLIKIKDYIQLLKQSIQQEQQDKIEDVRIWKVDKLDLQLLNNIHLSQQQLPNSQVYSQESTQLISSILSDDDIIVIEVNINGEWHFPYLESKKIAQSIILNLHNRILNGCDRVVCFNPYCANNPLNMKGLNKEASFSKALQVFNSDSNIKICKKESSKFSVLNFQNIPETLVLISSREILELNFFPNDCIKIKEISEELNFLDMEKLALFNSFIEKNQNESGKALVFYQLTEQSVRI